MEKTKFGRRASDSGDLRTLRKPYEEPVIIVGALRSGTTLLRLLLDHHPAIRCFAEFEELTRYLEDDGFPSAEEYRERLRTDRHARLKALPFDASGGYVRAARAFVAEAYRRDGDGRPVFGFTVHSMIHRLPELFPHARFLHIVRDPRDVARSAIGMGWVGTVYHGAEYWRSAEENWSKLRERFPSAAFYELAYEDLVRFPEATLSGVLGFLGFEFKPEMLEIGGQTTYEAPDPKYAQAWRRNLTRREIELVELEVGELMEVRGYERTRPIARPPSFNERMLLAFKNREARVRFNLNRFGPGLYLRWITSRRLPFERLRERTQLQINEIENVHVR